MGGGLLGPIRGQWLCSRGAPQDPGSQLGRTAEPQHIELKRDENAGISVNIRGLYPLKDRTKVSYLRDLAGESLAPFIAVQETHLTVEILSAEVQIPVYTLYRSDREGGRSHGGCALYCREDLTVTERFKYSNNCCESQVMEIKELELILINIYRPPHSPQQLFEDTIKKCQDVIDEVGASKTLLALGDYNFPFIQWPSRQIYSRDQEPGQMSSEKVQGKMLLDWAETNFMEQYILTPTRKGNILDLAFTNSENLIQGYTTIINSTFSDHNILRISLNHPYKNETKKVRKNPYPNMIYEYDLLNAGEEDWIRYDVLLTKLSEDYDDKSSNENTEEKLSRFYNLIEKAVVTVFEKKEAFKSEEERKDNKGNKIPKHLRILMRKKTSISKKILSSSSATKTLRLMKTLEIIERELQTSYKNMRLKKENEALSKIKETQNTFTSLPIPSLKLGIKWARC